MNTPMGELKTMGYVTLTYPAELRVAVDKTVDMWKQFCALPIEVKKGFLYSNNADGVGYELKEGIGIKADRKENFDVALSSAEWLMKNSEIIQNPIALEFVQNAVALVGVMKPTILEFARQAEAEFGLEGFAKEIEESEGGFFTRFIHYFGGRNSEEEIATAHNDQSGFTLHLYESAEGLQCLTYDGEWVNMPVSRGETVIIPAMQMQLRSKGELRALCHRVIATPHTAEKGRYSAVCFVQFKNTPRYDKDKCGRLQERELGFNYTMPLEEFAELFKK